MRARQSTIEWLRSYYEAIDNLRFEEVAKFLHEDCRNHYPGGAVVTGRETILRGARRGLGSLARIRHELKHAWEEDDELIFELEVTYWRRDGREIVRPGAGIFVLHDGRIIEQRLFVDDSGVWS